ncbi:PfkB family carbohydrate kinase [Mesorhizobium sp. M0514]|uniref:PfkB family carbohydrate kinase n=1 Tax=Mesorhizobium sp. M0514 TaxID=2956955 RepID=UPI003334DB8D
MSWEGAVDVAGTGFAVLDRVYQSGTMTDEGLGGSCANVLWSLAMLDRHVVPILTLGADVIGENLVEEFRAAGAETRYIARRSGRLSPVLAQHLDTATGDHSFSSFCPDTSERFPHYSPIERRDVDEALTVVQSCAVFYADRITEAIVEAMEATANAGGIVFFEPSAIGDLSLFARALDVTSILKFASDRLGEELIPEVVNRGIFAIVTGGAAGLDVCYGERRVRCEAIPVDLVLDTCGSGDMVSVGLINRLLTCGFRANDLDFDDVVVGARAGQRLASANCSFVGARGIFRNLGPAAARRALVEAE